ncbi:hypothetical protein KSP40_PGU013960 [Platanthera guangdongensis]|uniref:Desiccation-related protein PCC13-62 n=1 Tax=Platanthera guangdongensis TaxID=2320717 RepID=A0ABR2M6I2_9ASPA
MNPAAIFFALPLSIFFFFFTLTSSSASFAAGTKGGEELPRSDIDLLEFPLNLEYLEAEFFLFGAFGYGLDKEAPYLAAGGPSPIGARKADLTPLVRDIVAQFGYQEVGHISGCRRLRARRPPAALDSPACTRANFFAQRRPAAAGAIKKTVKGFPRPLLDLSPNNFAKIIDNAVGRKLQPPFDPYANDINYLIASYVIPYVGLTGYVGANPNLKSPEAKRLVAGLLGVESAQDAVIRALLYEHKRLKVPSYNISVAEFTDKISQLRDKLGGAGLKDKGLVVPVKYGAEGKIRGNVIAGNEYSLSYSRTPEEILRIVYGTGSASKPGGFHPKGAGGAIAASFLKGGSEEKVVY